jgi:hypothetical protein
MEAVLRPGEESWQPCLHNLLQRFSQLEAAVVVDNLRQQGGHAGRTAAALRKLPPSKAAPILITKCAVKGKPNQMSQMTPEVATPISAVVTEELAPIEPIRASSKKAALSKSTSSASLQSLPHCEPEAKGAQQPTLVLSGSQQSTPLLSGPAEKVPTREPQLGGYAKEARAVAVSTKKKPPCDSMSSDELSQGGVQNASTPEVAKAPLIPDSKLLFVAALKGDIQQLSCLINLGADLNGRYTGRPNKAHQDKIIDATPLHLVVTMGKADVVEALLRHGADFEAKMRRALGPGKPAEEQYAEMTPLHLAAMEGHTNIVEMLLAHGADRCARMQLTDRSGDSCKERIMTPIEIAREMVSKGHERARVISLLSDMFE